MRQRRPFQQFNFICVTVTAKSHSLKLMRKTEEDCISVCSKVLQQRHNGQLQTLGITTVFIFISSNWQHSHNYFSYGSHCICCESSWVFWETENAQPEFHLSKKSQCDLALGTEPFWKEERVLIFSVFQSVQPKYIFILQLSTQKQIVKSRK